MAFAYLKITLAKDPNFHLKRSLSWSTQGLHGLKNDRKLQLDLHLVDRANPKTLHEAPQDASTRPAA